tara:strand:+ start:145 stop:336 length:192 start_codon:yes stop_codon:yes gene_type:complete
MGDFKTRKFNGKRYTSTGSIMFSKKTAKLVQERSKKKGFNARIVKVKGLGEIKIVYRVFVRRK